MRINEQYAAWVVREQPVLAFVCPRMVGFWPRNLSLRPRSSHALWHFTLCLHQPIWQVEHVLLYDFPRDPIEYMRRVGRTARAGRKGVVTVLAWGRQVRNLSHLRSSTYLTRGCRHAVQFRERVQSFPLLGFSETEKGNQRYREGRGHFVEGIFGNTSLDSGSPAVAIILP